MKSLILITLVAVCYAHPQGFLADTPEVAAEKARFFQLYNEQARAAALAPDIHIYSNNHPNAIVQPQQQVITFRDHQPAQPIAPFPTNTFSWVGPVAAVVPAGLPGSSVVQNTPEVDAAIAEFNAAYDAALVSTGFLPGPRVNSVYQNTNPGNFLPQAAVHVQNAPVAIHRWTGPFASQVPAGLPGSVNQVVAETADVQAAKAAFAQTFNNQLRAVLG